MFCSTLSAGRRGGYEIALKSVSDETRRVQKSADLSYRRNSLSMLSILLFCIFAIAF
jgi:hypothetical protein